MDLKDISPNFRQERLLKAVTGLSIEQFSILITVFEPILNFSIEKQKAGKIKPNNGNIGVLKSAEDKLLFILYYLKWQYRKTRTGTSGSKLMLPPFRFI